MTEDQYIKRIIEDYIMGCDEEVMWSKWNGTDWSGPIRACVNCSDVFWWGCADAETIEPEEIDELIVFSKEGVKNGTFCGDIMWCCKKRNKRTQKAWWDKESRREFYGPFKTWMDEVVPLTEETRGYCE